MTYDNIMKTYGVLHLHDNIKSHKKAEHLPQDPS